MPAGCRVSSPFAPPSIDRNYVLSKCNFFVEVQLWPLASRLRPERWLENFLPGEQDYAVHLLNGFMFFSDHLTNEMFDATFRSISRFVRGRSNTLVSAQTAWRSFLERVLVTYVRGESPNPTDSGLLFARKSRQVIGIEESRIMEPEGVLSELLRQGPRPVVFVDDFVGTGDQFLATWRRKVSLPGGSSMSFESYSSVQKGEFYYCPLLCTQTGGDRLSRECSEVQMIAAHVVSQRYSVFAADSIIWPDSLRPTATDFVRTASKRAGIPDTGGVAVDDWMGYKGLGLALAFAHSVPDATIPLFYWEDNGWNPLIRRT